MMLQMIAAEELRCQGRKGGRVCDCFVTRPRTGERLVFVRTVRHSSEADPEHSLYACLSCRTWHCYRVEDVRSIAV